MSRAPYVEAGFGQSHEIDLDSVPVSGSIPDWLSGTLLRNGPGTFQVGQQRYRHWFDGLAMLHRFTISHGNVSYANRFLESKSYNEAIRDSEIKYSEFATDPCRSLFSRIMAVFDPSVTDSAKVNIIHLAEKYIALAETPIQVEFDPQTLKSLGVKEWDDSSFGRMTTVHPHTDSERAETINLVTRFSAMSSYCFRRGDFAGDSASLEDLATKRVVKPSYIHSFGMSENYLILVEYPLVVNPMSLLLWLRPYIENFKWEPERGTKFHVFDRKSGEHVRTFTYSPFFAFHHVNAFEREGKLICDLVGYDDNSIIDAFYLHRLEDPAIEIPHGTLRRFHLELATGRITDEQLSEIAIELPSFGYEEHNTSPQLRFIYGVGLQGRVGFYDQIVKVDIETGSAKTWAEVGCYPGEAVFVARPDGSEQDEGVLLSVVLDAGRGISFLLVLDAKSMDEIARAELPHPVLFGYHGIFTPERYRSGLTHEVIQISPA